MSQLFEDMTARLAADVARGPVGLCDWVGDGPELLPRLIHWFRRRPKIGFFDQVRWRPGHSVTGRPPLCRARALPRACETTAAPRLLPT